VSDSSNIEWTDATWNPVVGCSRVSAGCDHCYAVGMTRRLEGMSKAAGFGLTGHRAENYRGLTIELPQAAVDRGCGVNGRHFNGEVRCVEEALEVPLRWKKPKRIFVNSMSDLFHPKVPFEFIDQVFAVMALSPQHTFQVLTKRPERMAEYLSQTPRETMSRPRRVGAQMGEFAADWPVSRVARCERTAGCPHWPLRNVWLGTSCEDQAAADERIPYLLSCPAAVRFLSCEPLLGPIDLCRALCNLKQFAFAVSDAHADGFLSIGEAEAAIGRHRLERGQRPMIDWVIVGGESGPGARHCDVESIRSIVLQCGAAGVPCFVKQIGTRAMWSGPAGDRWPTEMRYEEEAGAWRVLVRDSKGGNPSEWPTDLRVRQMPAGGAA